MSSVDQTLKSKKPPIVEAVLDIECDMPPDWDLENSKEAAAKIIGSDYPTLVPIPEHSLQLQFNPAKQIVSHSMKDALGVLRFFSLDQKQLIQFRRTGFSFNRLAPYGNLDAYIPEIEKKWNVFVDFAKPSVVKSIRLRYVNVLKIPMTGGTFDLNEYFVHQHFNIPLPEGFTCVGFLDQYTAKNNEGHLIRATVSPQPTNVPGFADFIFDVAAEHDGQIEVKDWATIAAKIQTLRRLKNKVFGDTLTEKCKALFQ